MSVVEQYAVDNDEANLTSMQDVVTDSGDVGRIPGRTKSVWCS